MPDPAMPSGRTVMAIAAVCKTPRSKCLHLRGGALYGGSSVGAGPERARGEALARLTRSAPFRACDVRRNSASRGIA